MPSSPGMWEEIKRKLFHLTALIYVVGLIYLPRHRYILILTSALALEFVIELARLKIPAIGNWFETSFRGLFRREERTKFSGVFWMLLGVLVTVVISPEVPLAATALLYLILGDAMASLVGKRLGGPHWPGSDKRLSGSIGCFVVCVLIGSAMLHHSYGWPIVLIGAVVATLLERFTTVVNDNFAIPVGSVAALLAATRFWMHI